MAGIVFAGFAPHPPILLPEIGGPEGLKVKATIDALHELSRLLKASRPEVVVMITPHGVVAPDAVSVYTAPGLSGDFGGFGAPGVRVEADNDLEMARAVLSEADSLGVRAVASRVPVLDHGLMVPMYFLWKGGGYRLVPVAMGFLPYPELYLFGEAMMRAAEKLRKRVAVIASGDLSHRLIRGAPAGYDPAGPEYDRAMVDALGRGDVDSIINMDRGLVDRAGECGMRPCIMMLGALRGISYRPRVLSYQGPFGVGYAVASFEVEEEAIHPGPAELARMSLESYITTGKVLDPPDGLPEFLGRRAGAFVSLKKGGVLRGCIGTCLPVRDNLAEEIIENAISAGTRDPRFPPVQPEELPELEISVDILSEPERVKDASELDPKRYGVIVKKGPRTGLLLPDLEGVDSVRKQLAIACQKAGILPDEPGVEIYRFEVKRYRE